MNPAPRVYLAGHTGLVGSAIQRRLAGSAVELLTRTRAELDLTDAVAVDAFFRQARPEQVYLAAAKVGGIHANSTLPADFYRINAAIQLNVIDAAYRHGVARLLFLGSSCIYPRECPQPIKEEYLLSSALEPTNRPYALAKIGGIEMCAAYNRQYGTRFLPVMPTNQYGRGDNYDPLSSHVLPALIHRLHHAQRRGLASVRAWGSGAPRREFMYSDDLADACVHLMTLPAAQFDRLLASEPPIINIGVGSDISIRELAQLVAEVVGYRGEIGWDTSQPDGTPRKLLDTGRIAELGWSAHTPLREGIELTYRDYLGSRWAAVEAPEPRGAVPA